jgi:hypothetical protein
VQGWLASLTGEEKVGIGQEKTMICREVLGMSSPGCWEDSEERLPAGVPVGLRPILPLVRCSSGTYLLDVIIPQRLS